MTPLLLETLAGLNDGVALFDADAQLLTANRAFRDMNPKLEDLLNEGTSWDILLREAEIRGIYPKDVCKRLTIIEADLLGTLDDGHQVITPAGPGHSFVIRLSARSDDGFILTQTERLEDEGARDAESEVEVLLSKVLEACPACLTMSRIGDGQIIYRSPAATALLGQAKSSFSHFAKRAERADFITALLPDARVDDMRVTGIRADGSEFPAGISARLIEYRGEDVIVSNMEDLSSILAVQAELAQKRTQVFQAEKMSALGELLAGVAHELNNPLSIIVGNTEMLKEDLDGTPHTSRIDKMGGAAERCVKIVRSFLAMARQEPLHPKPTSAGEIFRTAQDAIGTLVSEHPVEVLIDLPDDLPDMMVDELQISQVMINLLTNAVHAIQDSGIGDKITVTGFAAPGSGSVTLITADNGPGVDDKIVTRIFDPLFTTKEVGRGTGVGLAFCHRVVSAHGGTIELIPKGTPGATFSVTLPQAMRR
ncbi:hybrid sensor histidine kinase/response regulator [Roseobacter sp. YSTF-M11]|uniref:histidine kinase n=1 Tax=Roseobacter insulae TaxID=2859783 RepID=A0A9X1FXN0_9RHOB|nr:PAS domain-containing sensor histidine kinase [Roseobacter insulae]MBW4710000.1 hybrid sensor histidine kinase/response regulator [Roseobacter insulae]